METTWSTSPLVRGKSCVDLRFTVLVARTVPRLLSPLTTGGGVASTVYKPRYHVNSHEAVRSLTQHGGTCKADMIGSTLSDFFLENIEKNPPFFFLSLDYGWRTRELTKTTNHSVHERYNNKKRHWNTLSSSACASYTSTK